jgi:hypothetical protein
MENFSKSKLVFEVKTGSSGSRLREYLVQCSGDSHTHTITHREGEREREGERPAFLADEHSTHGADTELGPVPSPARPPAHRKVVFEDHSSLVNICQVSSWNLFEGRCSKWEGMFFQSVCHTNKQVTRASGLLGRRMF